MNNRPNSAKASDRIPPEYEEVKAQIRAMLPAAAQFDEQQNLIELGLDSLQMMRLVNQWRRRGCQVTFAELIGDPSLNAWWSLLQRTRLPGDCRESGEQPATAAPFPLTDVQYAYWVGRQDDQALGGVGCHAYLEIDGGNIDRERLAAAWTTLLDHHGMLRAKFLADGLQQVMEVSGAQPLEVNDLRSASTEECRRELKRIRGRLSHRRLAVEKGEVAGLSLSLLPGGRARLHFDIDLLVADVQSLQILLRDLAAAYARGVRPPAPRNWSFGRYLRDEEQRRAADRETAARYWQERLDSLPGAPGLPLQEKPERLKFPVFQRRTYFIREAQWKSLQQLSAGYRVTPAMTLLAAYAEVLDRWSTTSRFLINIPLFDRQTGEAGLEEVVADFTNLLLLAVDCSSPQCFVERARSIQAQFHQDAAHTVYSGVQVQRDLARLRPGERYVAPVVFACNLGSPLINEECESTLGRLGYMISQTPQVWLDFQLYETDGGLLLAWDAVEELFADSVIDRMFDAYARLIEWLAEGKNNWLLYPTVFQRNTAMEQALTGFSELPPACRLHDGFFALAAAQPHKTALVNSADDTCITYGELADYALRTAALLEQNGVRPGDAVAVTLPRSPEQIAAVLGVLATGACYAPVSVAQPPARRANIHQKADIRFALTGRSVAPTVEWPPGTRVLPLEDGAGLMPLAEPAAGPVDDPAYIIFTSGSTGEPKGVQISHAGAFNTIVDINRRYRVGEQDRILAVSALDFDLSVYDIFGLLNVGGSLVVLPEGVRREAGQWLKLLDKYQVTLWNSVPVLLDMLLVAAQNAETGLPLRLVMLSGDWIGLDLPPRLNELAPQCRLVAMGGATEASIWSNYFDVALPLPENWTSVPYGRPLSNQKYRIVDGKGRDCPDWVAGELWIGGAGVALGYKGDPKLTAERFVDYSGSRWYRTGDLGRYWPDGNIEFLGRKDFQVKIKGHRIELGEIEVALREHPEVRNAVVQAVGPAKGNKQLIGYVVPKRQRQSQLWEAADADGAAEIWQELLQAGHEGSRELPAGLRPEQFAEFHSFLENLSLDCICHAFEQTGVFRAGRDRYTLEELLREGRIAQRYHVLIAGWLEIMADEGLLVREATGVFRRLHSTAVRTGKAWQELSPEWRAYARGILQYIQEIGEYHAGLLTGRVDPLGLFFTEKSRLSPEQLLRQLPGVDYRNSIAKTLLGAAIRQKAGAGPVQILQIGARSSGLTRELTTLLPPGNAVYTCTDSSAFFLNEVKQGLEDRNGLAFSLLDIEEDPQVQGYVLHHYDIIVAPDSLHRTRHIGSTLAHVEALLAPAGLLLMMEKTVNSRLQQVGTAFLEDGFTRFEDERKGTRLPLLSSVQWEEALQRKGYGGIAVFPGAEEAAACFGQQVIVALAPQSVHRFHPEKLTDFLQRKLPDYMVPSAFIPLAALPVTANGKVDRQALPAPVIAQEGAGKLFTELKTETQQRLAVIWRSIFSLDRIGADDNYFALGGDSLLATKLSGMIRSSFGTEMSLASIFELPTIAQMAVHIERLLEKTPDQSEFGQLPVLVPAPGEQFLPFPLTDIQQAYWFGRSGIYSLGNVSTHCYFEIEESGLDVNRVTDAWRRLIDHHAMMRAVMMPDGQSQRVLQEVPPYHIVTLDLRNSNAGEVEAGLSRIREKMSHQVLDAGQWPLFEVRASLFGENRVRLHVSFDNLIFDGWSMFHLLSEWGRLYRQPEDELQMVDVSFRDYVLALERLKDSGLYQRDRQYWFNRLADLPPGPELPLAQNPDFLHRQRFTRLSSSLNNGAWRRLKERAAAAGLTPSGVLLTAYAEVLSIWSKRPQFTINLTQFNRLPLHPQVSRIVGDFTTLTLLAVDHSSGKTFLERSRNLQQQLWQDLDHAYVGGVEVQRELARQRGDQQGAAMPVVFTSALGVNQWNGEDTSERWLGKLIYNITQTPQVWLDHQVVEQNGELLLIWDAVAGLFPPGLLEDMFGSYCQLLERLADEETVWREKTPNLALVPRLHARVQANDTGVLLPQERLESLFEKQVIRQPEKPAVHSPGLTLSYRELAGRASGVEACLRAKRVRPNTLVAVVMEKGWEQVVAALGILKSGAAYLPIDPAYPEERRQELLQNGHCSIVLTQSRLEKKLNWPEEVERILVDQLKAADRTGDLPTPTGSVTDLAYVIYTSGSTGVPNGVMIDHQGAVNTILDINRRFAVGPQDRILALSNFNFDLSVYDIFGMLSAGAAIILPKAEQSKDPAHWLALLREQKATVWNTVPALMQMLLEYVSCRAETMPASLRLVLLSGDWVPVTMPDKIKTLFPGVDVVSLGGATEASIWSNLYHIQKVDPEWKSIPYGRPLANQRYYVLNQFMGDCPVWVPGQLYIGGAGLAKGYWNNEAITRERFIDHPRTGERLYFTGDLGRYLPDGDIEFLGREDFQVKIRGHRIELGEIEAVMRRINGMKDAVVGATGELLTGYVVLKPEEGTKLFTTDCADSRDCALRWHTIKKAGQFQAAQIPSGLDVEEVKTFLESAEQISLAFICRMLAKLGIFRNEREQYSLDELMERFKLQRRYRPLIGHWLNILIEERIVEKDEAGLYLNHHSLPALLPKLDKEGNFPGLSETAATLATAFKRDDSVYLELLQGTLDPLELFVREDAFLTPDAMNQFNLARGYYTELARATFSAVLNTYPSDKEIRVMEIGGRTGNLAGELVKLLTPGKDRYLYTDESAYFTDQAKGRLSEFPPMEYGLLDMNKAPLQQGYEPHAYDVIIADNTLHRTRNVRTVLEHIKTMLAPGGILLFTETTRNNRLMMTTTGFFADGFSQLEDERSLSGIPLLTAEKWREVLSEKGFAKTIAFPANGQTAEQFGQHLLMAQAQEAVSVFKPSNLADEIRCKLPAYMVPTTYILLEKLPLTANGKVDRKALAQLGKEKAGLPVKTHTPPATETQMKLASAWKEVLNCQQVGIHDSFFELGGDSLRAIQCINLLKTKYSLELSLPELFETPDIERLARLVEVSGSGGGELTADCEEGVI
ncbi:non-ribosomal peptide synthetase|uniref:Yersiniabactin nonribosomal peptide synthetase n=1 Tax=Dendrosporobacter quercicolus TaxID=146817 RepID=A0A1G9RRE1_9FIRM|nr:non-ribosomal peptide synthetase [Dendrosporobacter quercicolus]NSL49370.1 non-ribosomal peptide synthetase [Dendrosporobacter quercicolus DSM 1736]SDM25888.1 yersiniabactin nonribosomal peptide synthetase [Dendrosporobacter quercicolus]